MKRSISRPVVGAAFATEPTLVSVFFLLYPGQEPTFAPASILPPQSNDLSGYPSGLVAWRTTISPVLLVAAGRASYGLATPL